MGTTYNGKAGNESGFAASVAISTTTGNAVSPIVVTTGAAHGLLEGDRVEVIYVGGNTAANGVWFAHWVSATQVALYSGWTAGAVSSASTGNGAFASTGGESISFLGLMPRTTIPDDGADLRTASAINVPNEDAKDGQAWLAERVGVYRLHNEFRQHIAQTPNVVASNGSTVSASWGRDAFGGLFGSDGIDVKDGDLVEIEVTGTIIVDGSKSLVALRPSYEVTDYGVAFTGTTVALATGADITVGGEYLDGVNQVTQSPVPVNLHATGVMSLTRGKRLRPSVDNYGVSGGNPTYSWYGGVNFIVRTWRRNA